MARRRRGHEADGREAATLPESAVGGPRWGYAVWGLCVTQGSRTLVKVMLERGAEG